MLLRFCAVLSLTLGAAACVDETSADTQAASNAAAAQGSGPGHPCGPPPQEALDACEGLAADDTCAFDIDGHHVDGTCRNGPEGDGPLACAPDRPPPPQEAIDACAGSAAGDTCAFSIDDHDVTGTCKSGPDGTGGLACAPDQPPPPPPH
jgi:hypothetical protein